jgi:flagellar biosynthetic protein FliP
VPEVAVELDGEGDGTLSRTVVIILLLTVGSVAPALLLLMTTFTRFIVVLRLANNVLGLQTVPPAQVLIGLAMFLTFFAMQPTLSAINDNACSRCWTATSSRTPPSRRPVAPCGRSCSARPTSRTSS